MSEAKTGDPDGTQGSTESADQPGRAARLLRGFATAVGIGFVTLLLFFLIEGAASSALFVRFLAQQQEGVEVTEAAHTHYDPDLGWVSTPDVSLPDQYGPGKGLTTNDRGFRGTASIAPTEPAGTRRVICSGDSFTLGHGVADGDTWCARLSSLDEQIESVNMGQGGYGIDQAYLWYRRDGSDLERSVHVLAFIGDDFFRMQADHFLGYGKPVLYIDSDTLAVGNVPVQERGGVSRWLTQNGGLFRELSTVRLLGGLLRGSGSQSGAQPIQEDTWEVASMIFQRLEAENRARGSKLVLLFLPTPWDYDTELYAQWRTASHRFAEESGIVLVDMVEELRGMPQTEALSLFIPAGEIGAPHLNEEGNAWVARHLLESGVLDPDGPAG